MSLGVGVVLGSAFDGGIPDQLGFEPVWVDTPFGGVELRRGRTRAGRPALVVHRHENPHRLLPHQINHRALIWALRAEGCGSVLLNSSVGVLDPAIPLFQPLLVTDLLMPDNRLPDGSLCTLFTEEAREALRAEGLSQGHLVLSEGIFSPPLRAQLQRMGEGLGLTLPSHDLVFVYAPGPRTKTPAENRYWATLGGQVNSMSVGPEAVLGAEAGMAMAALVVGHKRSGGSGPAPDRDTLAQSLEEARDATEALLLAFLEEGEGVISGNSLYRFGEG
jgi:5'-methylthioadenosine phosphorylase